MNLEPRGRSAQHGHLAENETSANVLKRLLLVCLAPTHLRAHRPNPRVASTAHSRQFQHVRMGRLGSLGQPGARLARPLFPAPAPPKNQNEPLGVVAGGGAFPRVARGADRGDVAPERRRELPGRVARVPRETSPRRVVRVARGARGRRRAERAPLGRAIDSATRVVVPTDARGRSERSPPRRRAATPRVPNGRALEPSRHIRPPRRRPSPSPSPYRARSNAASRRRD